MKLSVKPLDTKTWWNFLLGEHMGMLGGVTRPEFMGRGHGSSAFRTLPELGLCVSFIIKLIPSTVLP